MYIMNEKASSSIRQCKYKLIRTGNSASKKSSNAREMIKLLPISDTYIASG